MGDINKIFKEVFDDINLEIGKKVILDKRVNSEDIEYINNVFNRLEHFYKMYGEKLVNGEAIDKAVKMILSKRNFSLEESNIECKCGALIKVKYVINLNNKMNMQDDNYRNYGHTLFKDSRYMLKCSLCNTSIVIISSYDIVGIMEILVNKRLKYN